jgi:hypothetical protein
MAVTPEQVDALMGSDEEREAVEVEYYVSVLEEKSGLWRARAVP